MRLAISFILALALATPALAATSQVSIANFNFSPQMLTVPAGTTVQWTNKDDEPHTVTARDRSFHSGALDTSGKFAFTFAKPGVYAYFCSLHPHMTGQVVVK